MTTDDRSQQAEEDVFLVEEQGFGIILEYLEKENKAAEEEEKEKLLKKNTQK